MCRYSETGKAGRSVGKTCRRALFGRNVAGARRESMLSHYCDVDGKDPRCMTAGGGQ